MRVPLKLVHASVTLATVSSWPQTQQRLPIKYMSLLIYCRLQLKEYTTFIDIHRITVLQGVQSLLLINQVIPVVWEYFIR